MKTKFKKFLKFFIIAIILIPLLYGLFIFTILYIGRYQEIKAYEKGARNVEWQAMKQKIDARIDAQWNHIHAGRDYEEAGQYELAIKEYKKTIELGEDWMGHAGLARLYEKTAQYELAIKEIDWLISQKPREGVMDLYRATKKKIEAFWKESKHAKTSKNDFTIAIERYKEVFEHREPMLNEDAHKGLIEIYEHMGQYDLAIKELDLLIAQENNDKKIAEYTAQKQKLIK